MVRLMRHKGMRVPEGWRETTAMLLTYRVTDAEVVTREQADLIQIGFRCLYAELVHARVDKKQVLLRLGRF